MTTDTQMARAELGESIITIDGLNKWYGQFHVLKDIDLENTAVRLNRLALLKDLRGQFLQVADLAVLAR